MNDRSLSELLAELDAELAQREDADEAADDILRCVEARAPEAVMRAAAILQLRSLGCGVTRR